MSEHQVDIEIAENCLGHLFGNATIMAYNRTSLLERRRPVMQQWCDFVESAFKEEIPEEYLF